MQHSLPVSLLIPLSVLLGTTSPVIDLPQSSASGRDLKTTDSLPRSRGKKHAETQFCSDWEQKMESIYHPTASFLNPLWKSLPQTEAGWMSTDPVVCTLGRPHMGTLRQAGGRGRGAGCRSCVMTPGRL